MVEEIEVPRYLLTDLHIRAAKPKAKPYRIADGGGLFLYVPPSGVMAWQLRYRHGGKPQTATLGKLEILTLADARKAARKARKVVAKGAHLTVAKRVKRARRAASTAKTFGVVAADWVKREARRAEWTPDYKQEVTASLKNHLSDLDGLPAGKISAAIAAPVLRRAEKAAPDMAKKVRQRLRAIMDQAAEDGLIALNPIPAPRRRKRGDKRAHLPAVLDHAEVGAILRAADVAEVSRGVKRAHDLAAYTVQRIGELVPAPWSEVDLQAGTLIIPRERMKRKEKERGPQVVPLPPRLLARLREWKREDGSDAVHVCPAPHGEGHVTREAVEKFYRRTLKLSGQHSPHSWRSVFSTWARDAGKSSDVVESQLDHAIGSTTAQAYDRAERLVLRRELMTWFERALLAARDGADVVPLRRRGGP